MQMLEYVFKVKFELPVVAVLMGFFCVLFCFVFLISLPIYNFPGFITSFLT